MTTINQDFPDFFSSIFSAIEKFRAIDGKVRVVSHLDSDGISSASILANALRNEGMDYEIEIQPQLTRKILERINKEDEKYIFFTDLGSGHVKTIAEILVDKKIFILDHHFPVKGDFENITHVNPIIHGYDSDIAGAGVVYLFCEMLNEKNVETVHLAITGAIGDMQEKNGFSGFNKIILEKAVAAQKVIVKDGLKLFGLYSKPLLKVLLYSFEPYDFEKSKARAADLIEQLGADEEVFYDDLSVEQKKKLKELVKDVKNFFGRTYLINSDAYLPIKDLREFSTLLNACGRLNESDLGLKICLGDKKAIERSLDILKDYKENIIKSMDWFRENKEKFTSGDKFVIIDAGKNIQPTIIGTVVSIISNITEFPKDTFLLGISDKDDDTYKVSFRIVGRNPPKGINLREIINKIGTEVGCFGGGHKFAAGTIIPKNKKSLFIEKAIEILKTY